MKKPTRNISVQDNILVDGSISSDLKELLGDALVEMQVIAVDHKQPPWTAFPEYGRYSMGWRMGSGEDYWSAFHSWIRSLSKSDADAFVSSYPEPESWQGFYNSIDFGS